MLEFIICDDNKFFLDKIERLLNQIMIKKNIEYVIKKFNDYDKKFLKYIENNDRKKIYILDIDVPSCSGISISRKIRKNDYESVIIFFTGHEELGNLLLRKDIMFLSFINKFEDFDNRLRMNVEKALIISKRKPYLEIIDQKVIYNISLEKILYITRDSIERKIMIYTDSSLYKMNKSLTEIKNQLDDNFIQTHRACIINKNRAERIDLKKKYIRFDNGIEINLVSNNYKNGVKL